MTTADDWDARREKIIGLGEKSHRKSYYPELKRRLEELERFRTLLDFSNDAIFLIEAPSNQIIDVNKGACARLGYTRDQVLTYPLDQFVPVNDVERINAFLCDESIFSDEGMLITTYLSTVDHQDMPVEVTVQQVILGDQVYGILVARDISARLQMEKVLRESEERYRNLFDNMPVGLYCTTPEGQFIDVNPALAAMFGYPNPAAILATNAHDLYVNPDDRARWQALLEQEGIVRNFETQIHRADGTIIWVRNTSRIVRDENKNILFYEGSVEDITQHKAAEINLRTTLTRTEVLYRTGQSLIAVRDLPTILQTVVDGVVEALPADRIILITLDVDKREITHFVFGGPGKQQVIRVPFDELWQGLSGWVYRERVPAFSPKGDLDPRESPAVQQRRTETNCGSIAVVPIVEYGSTTLGVIVAINRPDQRDFTQQDVDLMTAMANQAAIAIQDTQLLVAEKEQRHFAEALRDTVSTVTSTLDFDEVLIRILENIERVVPHDAANIMRMEDDNFVSMVGSRGYDKYGPTEWIRSLRFPIKERPKTQRALEIGAGYIVTDTSEDKEWFEFPATHWIRSHICAPIRLEDQVLGVLHLDSSQPNLFTELHLKRLQAFADQVAIAIRNAQLFAAEQKRRHIAEMLRQASTVLGSTLQLDTVLQLLLQQLRQVIPYDTASVQQLRETNMEIVACEGFEKPEAIIGLVFPLVPQFPNYAVITTKAPVTFEDIAQEYPHFKEDTAIYDSGHVRSWLGTPLIVKDETVGIITLDRKTVHPYTSEETELAMAFANQAAIAIENARLYQELEAYSSTLERMVEARTEELRRTKEHIEAILNSVGEALVVTTPDGTIQQVNPSFEKQTGYEAEEIISSHISLLRSETTPLNWFGEMVTAMHNGKMWVGELRVSRKDGTVYDAAVTISPVRHSKSEPVAIVGSIRDISALKEVERMKDAFVSNVSHELRTPIANLKLRYHLLAAQPAKFDTHLAVIRRETDRLAQIIDDLLNLSRIDQGRVSWRPTSVDVNVLTAEYVEDRMVLAQGQDINLSVITETELPVIRVDAGLISQALGILLTNALNYTPPGGQVTVKTQQLERHGRPWIVLSVKDNGRGIPPYEQPNLFDRFFRGVTGVESGVSGTGLGLAIAQEIMKKHQGWIEVLSSGIPGEGAEFSLWLPMD